MGGKGSSTGVDGSVRQSRACRRVTVDLVPQGAGVCASAVGVSEGVSDKGLDVGLAPATTPADHCGSRRGARVQHPAQLRRCAPQSSSYFVNEQNSIHHVTRFASGSQLIFLVNQEF